MMYNRYIPGSNGIYQKHSINIPDPEPETFCKAITEPCEQAKEPTRKQACRNQSRGWDLGDILLLCIVVLLLIDSEEGEMMPILIAVAAYLFLQ